MDPLVFWMNSQLIQNYWAIHAPTAPVSVLDLESPVAANDPYGGLKNGFAAAKDLVAASAVAQGANDGGALAVAEAYHATLVAPFCFAAVKSFFGNY
jgi:hypothetical protein